MERLERVLRDEWGRLLALLAAWCRRVDLAEDGLADAFEAAARTWPETGAPANPQGWLLTTARRRITDALRTEAVAARKVPLLEVEASLQQQAQRMLAAPPEGEAVMDERLRLVLLCAHPSLSREASAALTLRLVLGVATEDVARLFLVPTATMAARLTRARRRLAGAAFVVPPPGELGARVDAVADVAYLAFTSGYAPGSGADVLRADVAGEAVRLVRVLRSVLPERYDELDALLALMVLQHARRDARAVDGRLVLLPDQDRTRWHHDEALEALDLLRPLVAAPPAPYLLQALIAAEHAIAVTAGETRWDRIVDRYDELLALRESPVVRLNRAVAIAERDGPAAGLAALDGVALPGHRLPAVRAELLARLGRPEEARLAYDTALAQCGNEAEAAHLRERRG
ncbi:RNA polymerase sigma factor [Nocardioides humi]|uniref:RNA polymerase sigma factor n=1 Tax=Nocardioides humi TaxID=449461 RepID=A0ABN2B296_9ACTN|nr:DUF6596 domain-containing protein [Nocardioides humi]